MAKSEKKTKKAKAAPTWEADPAGVFFSDRFDVHPAVLEKYGAFDISRRLRPAGLHRPVPAVQQQQEEVRRRCTTRSSTTCGSCATSAADDLDPGLIKSWYTFKEVKQNWLGFTVGGNDGHGLGPKFAKALHAALGDILNNFGDETITSSSHLEKLALIRPGVGRDNISDFTTNLIKHFLLRLHREVRDEASRRARPQAGGASSAPRSITAPRPGWPARTPSRGPTATSSSLPRPTCSPRTTPGSTAPTCSAGSTSCPSVVDNDQLRADVNRYFKSKLTRRPTQRERDQASAATILAFPELIDCYIKLKEDTGDQAVATSRDKVDDTLRLTRQVQVAARDITEKTDLFDNALDVLR